MKNFAVKLLVDYYKQEFLRKEKYAKISYDATHEIIFHDFILIKSLFKNKL